MGTLVVKYIKPIHKKISTPEMDFLHVKIKDTTSMVFDEFTPMFWLWEIEEMEKIQKISKIEDYKLFLIENRSYFTDWNIRDFIHMITKAWEFEFQALHSKKTYLWTSSVPVYTTPKIPYPYNSFSKTLQKRLQSLLLIWKMKWKWRERLSFAIYKWGLSYGRVNILDGLLDCCTALESLFGLSGDIRLKLSLWAYHLLKTNRKIGSEAIYDMYGKRSDFIHGRKIPIITEEELYKYISITGSVIISAINFWKIPEDKDIINLIKSSCH